MIVTITCPKCGVNIDATVTTTYDGTNYSVEDTFHNIPDEFLSRLCSESGSNRLDEMAINIARES